LCIHDRPAGLGVGLLGLDDAVTDGLGGGQGTEAARVLADLVHLAACDLGQPVVQGVEHAGHLLLARGDRGDGAAELEPRLWLGLAPVYETD
jgi:hypothetical protein